MNKTTLPVDHTDVVLEYTAFTEVNDMMKAEYCIVHVCSNLEDIANVLFHGLY